MRRERHHFVALILVTAVAVFAPAMASAEDASALSAYVADLYRQGLYAKAIPIALRVLKLAEDQYGADHAATAKPLNDLAHLYQKLAKYDEAESLLRHSLTISEKAGGLAQADVALTLNDLAAVYHAQGRYKEADAEFQKALLIQEAALRPGHPDLAPSLIWQAERYLDRARYAEAEALFARALSIREKAFGPDHLATASSQVDLSILYALQGRDSEADAIFARGLAALERRLGPHHPEVADALNRTGMVSYQTRRWLRAIEYLRRGTTMLARRADLEGIAAGRLRFGSDSSGPVLTSLYFWCLANAGFQYPGMDGEERKKLAREMFVVAQSAQSSAAAAALTQLAARGASSNSVLLETVRNRNDLASEWGALDRLRESAMALGVDDRDRAANASIVERLGEIEKQIMEIDAALARDFPGYSALVVPTPLSIDEVQRQLGADEALVFFLDIPPLDRWMNQAPAETLVWTITKTEVRWTGNRLNKDIIRNDVAALRCGLDLDASSQTKESDEKCTELLSYEVFGRDPSVQRPGVDTDDRSDQPRKFNVRRAYNLYKRLFAGIEDLVLGKQLLVVPPHEMKQLPFHVLVTIRPPTVTTTDYRSIAWLARSSAVTVLPAVSSLKALRQDAGSSKATKPFLGVGNPLLDGDQADPNQIEAARQAQDIAACPEPDGRSHQVATHMGLRGMAQVSARGGLANIDEIRRAPPLPETADELCNIAKIMGAEADDVLLGSRATESAIKRLSDAGALRDYRIVHFATHGILAGEVSGSSEPGLLLTPPAKGSETDDGYLSASEIAGLKLDADWVVLSACNTAAGGDRGGDALSGLARAFFYAGARTLLVSHWYVQSESTVALMKGIYEHLKASPKLGRAEAVRRSILALIDEGKPPSLWAPFVMVGVREDKSDFAAPSPNPSLIGPPLEPGSVTRSSRIVMSPPEASPPPPPMIAPPAKKAAAAVGRRSRAQVKRKAPAVDDWARELFRP